MKKVHPFFILSFAAFKKAKRILGLTDDDRSQNRMGTEQDDNRLVQ